MSKCCTLFTSSHSSILQNHSIVDEPDIFGWCWCSWSLPTKQVEYPGCQHSMFTVLYKLAEVSQASLFGLCVLFDNCDDTVHYSFLVLKSTLRKYSNACVYQITQL